MRHTLLPYLLEPIIHGVVVTTPGKESAIVLVLEAHPKEAVFVLGVFPQDCVFMVHFESGKKRDRQSIPCSQKKTFERTRIQAHVIPLFESSNSGGK